MQSLQMRWPVAAAMGLSMVTMASAPTAVAVLLHHVHLGDFFIQRATGQRDAEDGLLEFARFFLQAGGATVFALVVALDAVIGLIERAGQRHAGVGKLESFAIAPVLLGQTELGDAVVLDGFNRDQVHRIELVRHLEEHVAAVMLDSSRRKRGPGGVALCGLDLQERARSRFQSRRRRA